jgi:hypothetical protein
MESRSFNPIIIFSGLLTLACGAIAFWLAFQNPNFADTFFYTVLGVFGFGATGLMRLISGQGRLAKAQPKLQSGLHPGRRQVAKEACGRAREGLKPGGLRHGARKRKPSPVGKRPKIRLSRKNRPLLS